MTDHRAVKFHRSSAPYEAGDVAGFPAIHAQRLVDRGVAAFWPSAIAAEAPAPGPDILDGMDREQLIGFGREHLGLVDAPGADVADNALRDAIRGSVDAALLKIPPHAEAPKQLMQIAPAGKGGKKG